MLIRIFFLGLAVAGLAWFLGGDDGVLSGSSPTSSIVDGASMPTHSQDSAYPVSAGGSTSLRTIFGQDASPFGRLDCSSKFQTTACNPEEIKDGTPAITPVVVLIRDQSEEVKQGKYESMEKLTSNLRECSARAAAAERMVGITADQNVDPKGFKQREDLACNMSIVAELKNDVKTSLEVAARGDAMAAKLAYADLLKSDLLEAIAVLYRDRAKGTDPTTSKAKVVSSKAELMTYLTSGNIGDQQAKPFLVSLELLDAEP